MVLASIPDTTSLEKLVEMPDKIMEVVAPSSIAAASMPNLRPWLLRRSNSVRMSQGWKNSSENSLIFIRCPAPTFVCHITPTPTPPHQKFGEQAQKCGSLCSWSSNEQAGHWTPSHLFYIHDHITGSRFLVDTSAEVSIIPPSHVEQSCQQWNFNLFAVNNTEITAYGVRSLTINLRLNLPLDFQHCRCEVAHPGC